MGDGPTPGAGEASLHDLPEPHVLARLVPFMHQSIMVVRRDWSVTADLAPPGGLLGRGLATGRHPFSDMHPDDVERVADLARQAMRSPPGWQGSMEFRAQRADGTYGLFHIRLHNRFDDPVLRGIVVVATELPSSSRPHIVAGATRPSSELAPEVGMQMVGDHLPIGLLLLDHHGAVAFANQTACALLDTDTESLNAGIAPHGLASVDLEELFAILHRLRSAPGKETFTAELAGDTPRLLSGTFVSRAGEGTDGAVQFVIVTIEDVTHRLAREQHLEHRANHDSLTGLPNRAWLLDHLEGRLAAHAELAVAFVDLDGFKAVNDRLGHAAGDDLLAEIAGALRASLLPGETVARVGGDEFVVVAEAGSPVGGAAGEGFVDGGAGPDVDRQDLRSRIRKAVESTTGASLHGVGVSVGLTESRPGDLPWDILGRADAAMYGDKRRHD